MRNWIRRWQWRHAVKTIAKRLDWLFTHHLKADGTPYTYAEIEAIIGKQSRRRVDAATIEQLRRGQIKEPDWFDLKDISEAFGILNHYLLFDDDRYTDHDLEEASRAAPRGENPLEQLRVRASVSVRARLDSFVEQGLIPPLDNLDLLHAGLCVVDRRLNLSPDAVTDEELLALARRGDEYSSMMRGVLDALVESEQVRREAEGEGDGVAGESRG